MDENFWKNAPKTFCDNANMVVMEGLGNTFLLGLLSGQQGQVFTFTPEHMKRLSQLLSHNVKAYEEKNGAIPVEDWTPEMKSPIQIDDLGGK